MRKYGNCFTILTGFLEIWPRPIENYNFLRPKSQNLFFFSTFFIPKLYNFISNMNDDFHEASFEVYYVSVSQKLVIFKFSAIFFHFDHCNFRNLLKPKYEPQ
jgi:hypothetical protein